ncbi:uncharacterized protein TRIREDRAFT_109264 [Trichoderma reesei QM6a]|uniref:Predicted protein n=2 Tax=Hypocrea jecorina TaxID=51453 RepID=G0RP73_HYPJQ|nr:uncharacterized protein TRIREDRAFT_109264 [Trichoderma reesei QM6a]EGR47063.1 predicted protein [Trichoderma reesei QM6a]ETR99791.1 hypothetical protein M419DRAFT_85178 [Trichoderma reesei RUT C-30]
MYQERGINRLLAASKHLRKAKCKFAEVPDSVIASQTHVHAYYKYIQRGNTDLLVVRTAIAIIPAFQVSNASGKVGETPRRKPVLLIKKFGIAKSEPPSYHRLLHDRISIQRSHFDEGIHSFLTDLVVSRTGRVILALGAEILRLLQTRPYLLVRDSTLAKRRRWEAKQSPSTRSYRLQHLEDGSMMNDPKLTRDRCLTEALHAPAVTPASLKYISSSSENVSLRRDHEKASRSARPTIDIEEVEDQSPASYQSMTSHVFGLASTPSHPFVAFDLFLVLVLRAPAWINGIKSSKADTIPPYMG